MQHVYVLQSGKDGRLYVGSSSDLKSRYKSHNYGRVTSTKAYRPWTLIYYEAYRSKTDAIKREKQLKMHAAKEELKNRLKYSLE